MYRVELTSLVVPQWAWEKQPPEFERADTSRQVVWLKDRVLAKILKRMDAEDGGHPNLLRVVNHQCKVCGRVLLGAQALARLRHEGADPHKRLEPCGPECIADRDQAQWNKKRTIQCQPK